MCPLTDSPNGHPLYTPWTHRDLNGLMDELPPIKDGAGKWIRTFERKTTADRLTVGDVRAVLMQGAGPRAVRDGDAAAGAIRQPDNSPLDPFRPGWWDSPRDLYPTLNSGARMSDPARKCGETTGEYRTRANYATEAAFRTAVVNGFSPKTRESLNSVIGLGEMGQRAWEQAVVHHVTREAKKETEDDKEELELKRRLLRMDVKTATQNLNRDKKESSKEQQPTEIMALAENPQPSPYAPPQTNNRPRRQPQANYSPQAQFYSHDPPQNHFQPAPAQPWQLTNPGSTQYYAKHPQPSRGGSRTGTRMSPDTHPCYRCHQLGHWANRCPQRDQRVPQDTRPNGYARHSWPGPQNPSPNPSAPMYPTWTDRDYRDGPRQY